ncbi:hypothetical protein YC2023_066736 [Brassica napus]
MVFLVLFRLYFLEEWFRWLSYLQSSNLQRNRGFKFHQVKEREYQRVSLRSLPTSDLLLAPPVNVDALAFAVINAVKDD